MQNRLLQVGIIGIWFALLLLGDAILAAYAFHIKDESDSLPPETMVTIVGNYNSNSGWYYGKALLATFDAVDDLAGVKSIFLQSKMLDKRCSDSVCTPQLGDLIYSVSTIGREVLGWLIIR